MKQGGGGQITKSKFHIILDVYRQASIGHDSSVMAKCGLVNSQHVKFHCRPILYLLCTCLQVHDNSLNIANSGLVVYMNGIEVIKVKGGRDECVTLIYTVSQKTSHFVIVYIFAKY